MVVLHLWLAMTLQPGTDEGNGTITMQGFGIVQSVDPILVSSGGSVCCAPALQLNNRTSLCRKAGMCLSRADLLHAALSYARITSSYVPCASCCEQRQTVLCCPQLVMPPAAEPALRQEGYLYLEQRSTERRFNISVRDNGFPSRSRSHPFHLSCILPVS